MSGYPALLESVSQIAEAMQDLNRRAVREYTPVIWRASIRTAYDLYLDSILASRSVGLMILSIG
jgi:hypothetical protein